MSAETWFKIIFIAAFVYAVTVAARTARMATRRHGGSLNQLQNEVRGLVIARALLGLVFYGMLIVWLVRSDSPAWARINLPLSIRWTAAALLVPALAFFTWAFHSLGANYRGGVGLYDDHELVTTGAYAFVRHPIYVAFIAVMLLVLVLSANWLLGLSGLILVTSIAVARVPTEERELEERFGEEWRAYRGRGRGA